MLQKDYLEAKKLNASLPVEVQLDEDSMAVDKPFLVSLKDKGQMLLEEVWYTKSGFFILILYVLAILVLYASYYDELSYLLFVINIILYNCL